MIEAELALNAFLACLGAFFLIARMVESRTAALAGGLFYGLSGFFAGHSSHVGIFAGAACFPWLLLAFHHALDGRAVRYTALGGVAGAAMILAGYFQTAMYGFLALGLYALAELYRAPRRWVRVASVLAGMLALAIALAAIQVVPTLELVQTSSRTRLNYTRTTDGELELRALPTMVAPDWLGAISDRYTGPIDKTQYYFYAGFLLLPLAALGLAKTKTRFHALCLAVPSAWFMLGPGAGLYRVAMLLPGMNKVREPVQGWFIVALGMAMLAAAGFAWAERRWRVPYLGAILIAILFVDVWYWNSIENPLAYGHFTFASAYGDGEDALQRHVAPALPPLTRFDGGRRPAVGPWDGALDIRMENTVGYAALPIRDYVRYRTILGRNPALHDGLNVSLFMKADQSGVVSNPTVLPRVYFPKSILLVGSKAEAARALETLDPHLQSIALAADLPTIVPAPHSPIVQDPAATATVLAYDEESYRIRYHAAAPALLRLSVPYFQGWRATVDRTQLPIVHIDLALMGVMVPAGDHELQFRFHSDSFGKGVAITLAALVLCLFLIVAPARKPLARAG
jgi:hypothetical protein